MRRLRFSALAAVLLVGGLLLGREEKPPTLTIPADSGLYLSLPVNSVWEGTIGKELRALFEKEINGRLQEIREATTFGPSDIERLTLVAPDLRRLEGDNAQAVTLLRFAKSLKNDGVLAQILPDARTEKIHGQRVFVRPEAQTAGFVTPDGRTLVLGTLKAVESLLDPKTPPAKGRLAEAIAASKADTFALFARPTDLQDEARDLTRFLPPARTLLASPALMLTAVLGPESTLSATIDFANEKEANRGYKALNGLRTLTTVSLSGSRDALAGKSAALKALLPRLEAALDDAPLEQKGTAVRTTVRLKLSREERLTLFKEVILPIQNAARSVQSQNNLKQIGLAMHNYEGANSTFPASATFDKDGKALLSWRVHLLPYLGQEALYKQFKLDEPWDSAHNKKLLTKMPAVYALPPSVAGAKPGVVGGTYYQVWSGKGTFFDGKRGRGIATISDGTSNTFLVVEAARAVPWTKPEDLPFDAKAKLLPLLGGHFEGGFHVVMGDGAVRFFKNTLTEAILKLYIQPDDGMTIPNHD